MMRLFLFILSLLALVVSCTDLSGEAFFEGESVGNLPEMVFSNGFKREHYEDGVLKWIIVASNAKVYNAQKMTVFEKMFVRTIEGTNVTAKVKSDFGILYTENNNVELHTNVIIRSSNNTRLYTQRLDYDASSDRMHTTNHVRIIHPSGHWVIGIGMEADLGMDEVVIYKEVDEGFSRGLSLFE